MSEPTLPSEYLVLRQPVGGKAVVVLVKAGAEEVLFSGGRWPARHFARDYRKQHPIAAFCEKRGRGGHPGGLVAVTDPDAL